MADEQDKKHPFLDTISIFNWAPDVEEEQEFHEQLEKAFIPPGATPLGVRPE